MEQNKIIIEAKGKKVEIPLHIIKLELNKSWGSNEGAPEIVIGAVAINEEEKQRWGEIYGLLC